MDDRSQSAVCCAKYIAHCFAEESTADTSEAPAMTAIPTEYMVKCTSRKFFHRANFMFQIPDTVTIGEVEKVGDNHVCQVTVSTKAYADAYSKETGKVHAAIKPSVTYNMTWDGEKWNAPKYSELPTIEVACARYHCWFPFGK